MTSSLCLRPAIEAHTLRDGRTYDRCRNCGAPGPLDDGGVWSAAHRATAREVNDDIDAPGATPVGLRDDPLHAEREELRSLAAEDGGGTRRVGGARYLTEDLPSGDDLGRLA